MSTRVDYTCDVDPECRIPLESLAKKVREVLNDPRGWNKYGYEFTEHSNNEKSSRILNIILVTADKAKRQCGSRLGGFSCYSPDENVIYLNLDNWMGKSASSLPLDRYRTYVINHEVGHRLGFGHPAERNCQTNSYCNAHKGAPGSVMIQMTRGPDWVAPCTENEWPLDPADYDETKNPRLDNRFPVPIPFASNKTGSGEPFIVYSGLPEITPGILFVLVVVAIIIAIYSFACDVKKSMYVGESGFANSAYMTSVV